MKWTGLDEQYAQLASLVEDLTTDTAPEVERAATDAKTTIYNGYPKRTGNLRDGLIVQTRVDPSGGVVKAVVINTSPHAAMFERGTQARHNAIGANRGSMPANPIFSATLIRERRGLYDEAIPNVLKAHGVTVVGRA
jgi:hypothetical protein